MKYLSFLKLSIIVSFFFVSLVSFGSDSKSEKPKTKNEVASSCDTILAPSVTVGENILYPSGRDADVFPKYVEAAKVIFGEGGIAQQLGYSTSPHQLTFAPSYELSALASVGWHPAPHFIDGAKVVHGIENVRGVLEFVQPGCPTCRSFYRDTTEVRHQYAIMAHVAGHNDFSNHSMFALVRNADPIASSLHLADVINQYYLTYDRDAVAQWVQYLFSISSVQDYPYGTYDSVEKFLTDIEESKDTVGKVVHATTVFDKLIGSDSSAYKKAQPKELPKSPSASVFQAVIANLPADSPKWKREIAEAFEKTARSIPFIVQTKIMNEGWATMTQILMMAHSPWTASRDSIDFARLLAGVVVPKISNPYWLGLEAWIHIYKRFNKTHPEYEKLTLIEKDQKFVEYAHRDLINHMTDAEFLREALDDQWIADKKLTLYRKAEFEEWDRGLPQDRNPENNYQYVVVSKDGKRVVDYLVRMLADKSIRFPRILVDKFNAFGRNVFSLKHAVVDGVPLERFSASQMLFILSQALERPVSLETVASTTWIPAPVKSTDDPMDRFSRSQPVVHQAFPIRMEVAPNGKVRVYVLDANHSEQLHPKLSEELQFVLDAYRSDADASFNEDLIQHWREQYSERTQMLSTAVDKIVSPAMAMPSRAPTVNQSVEEYARMIRMRLLNSIRAAIRGSKDLKQTSRGVAVKVMPDVPEFQLDRRVQQMVRENITPAPVDDPVLGRSGGLVLNSSISKDIFLDHAASDAAENQLPLVVIDLNQYSTDTAGSSVEDLVSRLDETLRSRARTVFRFDHLDESSDAIKEFMHLFLTKRRVLLQGPSGKQVILDSSQASVWVQKASSEVQLLAPIRSSELLVAMSPDDGVDIGAGNGKPGDKFWGPNPNGGEGQGPGQGKPGEPGEDALDPSDVEVDLEFYGKILAEELELPNIRRTRGKSERVTWRKEDAVRKMDGNPLWHRMIPDAIARAIVMRKKAGLPYRNINPRVLAREGLKYLTEQDKIVVSQEPVKEPDFKAVIVFVIDMSGSMSGIRQQKAKEIVFNAKALLKANYKHVEFRYVGFDTKGHEFTEEEVFGKFLSGGTLYASGIQKSSEILSEYDPAQWNRYQIVLGDGESGEQDAVDSIKMLDDLYPTMQYMGFGYLTVSDWGGGSWRGPFSQAIQDYAVTKEWFGFAEVDEPSKASTFKALRAFFGKK